MTGVTAQFLSLGLNKWVQKKCDALKYKIPTEVQQNIIPPTLEGKDIIAIAKTGSGKTAAFALPILNELSAELRPYFGLVITPTRELAIQIKHQFDAFGSAIGVRSVCVIGGVDVIDQILNFKEAPHILISTPGRLASFIRNKSDIDLSMVKYFVIDEADRIFDDGFGDDMASIITVLSHERQTLLFTATINATIQGMINQASSNRFVWQQHASTLTVESLEQSIVLCPAYAKEVYLIHLLDRFLDENQKGNVIIFSNSCKFVKMLGLICDKINIKNLTLHSAMKQKDRVKSLHQFKSSLIRVLISTDVASRGLDIPSVSLVLNHNVPYKAKNYVHRVGRTARAGKKGSAITLVTPFDLDRIKSIEGVIKSVIGTLEVDESLIGEIFTEVAMAKRKAERQLDEVDFVNVNKSELEKEKIRKRRKEARKTKFRTKV